MGSGVRVAGEVHSDGGEVDAMTFDNATPCHVLHMTMLQLQAYWSGYFEAKRRGVPREWREVAQ